MLPLSLDRLRTKFHLHKKWMLLLLQESVTNDQSDKKVEER